MCSKHRPTDDADSASRSKVGQEVYIIGGTDSDTVSSDLGVRPDEMAVPTTAPTHRWRDAPWTKTRHGGRLPSGVSIWLCSGYFSRKSKSIRGLKAVLLDPRGTN
jgi:hypothetical protein